MTTFQTLRIEINDSIASVYLSNGKTNAMSSLFFQEIGQAFHQLSQNTAVRVIVLRADGKYFTVGLDLKDSSGGSNSGSSDDVARKAYHQRVHILELQATFTTIENCPQPVIFATHGAVIGGGKMP